MPGRPGGGAGRSSAVRMTETALDLEGHCWTFSAHVRDVTRAEAEAALGQPIMAPGWQ